MNEIQIKKLLDSVILLSDTVDLLAKPNCTQAELIAYSNVKKAFMCLMETPIVPHTKRNIAAYELNRRKRCFELIRD
jgi:hypothetical protein